VRGRDILLRVRTSLLTALVAPLLLAAPAEARVSGSWTGSYTLVGTDSFTVTAGAGRAVVALGSGHAGVQDVAASTRRTRLRFRLPGRPSAVSFDGRLRGRRITGTVRQGRVRGRFSLRRGRAPKLVARGYYQSAGGTFAVVDGPVNRLVDVASGEVRALYPSGGGFTIGSGFAAPASGGARATFDVAGATIRGERMSRIRVRQLEVRFASVGATLAGTLTLPPGPGPHPAVAFVQGSGPTPRAYLPDLHALLVGNGVAVLAYDKRGVAQSGGDFPGERATADTVDVLGRDAEAAVRFLASQPEIDGARVGLAGHSQAGWIMPLAATRLTAVRFLVDFAGPAVTQSESDAYGDLAGEGVSPPQLSPEEIDRRVLALGPSGFDPMPSLRALGIPAFFAYGGLDPQVPTRLSVQRLQPLAAAHDFTVAVFPNANHALVETQSGLTSEMLASSTFAPGLFPAVRDWLRARGLAGRQR
jgi:dienelactone hydrolase